MSDELISINCPFSKLGKDGLLYSCNRVCVKVEPGSKGEVWCRSCKLKFNFEVDSQSRYKPIIKVQREDSK